MQENNAAEVQEKMEQIRNAISLLSGTGVNTSQLASQLIDMDKAVNTAHRNSAAEMIDPSLTKGYIWVAIYNADGTLRQDVAVSVARAGLQVRIQPSDGTHYTVKTANYTPRAPRNSKSGRWVFVTDWGKLSDEYCSKHRDGDLYRGYPGLAKALGFVPAEHTTSEEYKSAYIVLKRIKGVEVRPATDAEITSYKLSHGLMSQPDTVEDTVEDTDMDDEDDMDMDMDDEDDTVEEGVEVETEE